MLRTKGMRIPQRFIPSELRALYLFLTEDAGLLCVDENNEIHYKLHPRMDKNKVNEFLISMYKEELNFLGLDSIVEKLRRSRNGDLRRRQLESIVKEIERRYLIN